MALIHWMMRGISWACLALEEDRTYHLHRTLAILEGNVELLDPEWEKANPDLVRAAYDRHRTYLDRFGKRIWDAPVQTMTLDAVTEWIRDRARERCRVIVIDPITAAAATERVWVGDGKFVNAVKAIVRSHDTSLMLVTHPKKGVRTVGLDDLAGGAAYQRLTQAILWLERHKHPKKVTVQGDCGRYETKINNTLHICKARNGRGHGLALGFTIDWPTLSFAEQGIIIKESRNG
jgi:hypothetical protein